MVSIVAITLHLPLSPTIRPLSRTPHCPLHRQSHRTLLSEAIRRFKCMSPWLTADAAEPTWLLHTLPCKVYRDVFCLCTSSSHYGAMRAVHATRMLDASNGWRSRFLPFPVRLDSLMIHSRLVLCKWHMSSKIGMMRDETGKNIFFWFKLHG